MSFGLEGVALILGDYSGFGVEAALELARRGMDIAGVHLDRRATLENAERIVGEIRSMGRRALFFNVNAADADRRTEVLDVVAREFADVGPSPVRVLLHSLAFGSLKPFIAKDPAGRVSQAQMDMTLDVMANSLVYWAQDLVSRELMGQGGRIFAMTSSGGQRVWGSYGPVSAAKAALESHVRQLALELAPYGITVNALRAGVTDTPALRKIPGHEEMAELARKRNPFRRLTTPADVAQALAALCLPETYWITGNVIGVDGGEDIVG
ncbi:MAG: enoyl-ACP reductase FabI, partial [Armatimonadota bacterium]